MDVMDKELKVPKLRFKDDGGREFPQWEERKLGEVCKIVTGNSNVDESLENGKYRFFDRGIDVEHFLDSYYLDTEAIIYAGEGSSFLPRYYEGKFALHQRCYALYNFVGINIKYCYYYLLTCNNHFMRYAVGTTVKSLRLNSFQSCIVFLPTLPEQRKIADFLTAYDELIDNQKKRVEVLKLRKKGLLQKIFSQEIRFKDDEGREFPAWEERRLGDCAEINPLSVNLPKRFIYIDLESVKSGRLLSYKVLTKENAPSRAQRQVLNGDILFQMVRPYQNNHLLFNEISKLPVVASTGYSILRCNKNYSGYIYYAVQEKNFFRDMLNSCVGATYPAINVYSLSMLKILLPTLPEQRKIADFLSVADHQITLEEKRLDTMRLIKKALFQQLFV